MSSDGAYLSYVAMANGSFPLTMSDVESVAALCRRSAISNLGPVPEWKLNGHNRKLKGWQKGGKRK